MNSLQTENKRDRSKVGSESLLKNFQLGDMLFGREDVREIYRPKLEAKYRDAKLTADDFNNKLLPFLLDDGNGHARLFADGEYEEWYASLDRELQEHLVALVQQEKHSPLSDDNHRDHHRDGVGKDREKTKYTRACKAMVLITCQKGGKIRFCTDGVSAKNILDPNDPYYHTHTSSELRFIKKHWHDLQDSVVFYQKEKQCELEPWKDAEKKPLAGYGQQLFFQSEPIMPPVPKKKRTVRKFNRGIGSDKSINPQQEQHQSIFK